MAEGYDKQFSLFTAVLIIIAVLVNYWLLVKKVEAGQIYFYMLLATIGFYVIAMIFIKGDELTPIARFLKSPFSVSLGVACLSYVVGWIIPFLFQLFAGGLNIVNFSIPLSASGVLGNQYVQSFSAVEFSESMPWRIFNISFNAGLTEEFAFTFGLMMAGVIFGLLIAQLLFTSKNKEVPLGKKNFILVFALLFSTGAFMYAHQLNGTYMGAMFLIAGIFKLISIISIYYFKMFLSFWIGYHQSNNLIFLIQHDGGNAVLKGFISWFGAFFVIWFLLIFWYLINHWEETIRDLKQSFRRD